MEASPAFADGPSSVEVDKTAAQEESVFNYEILRNPELRAEYITLTDDLVRKLVEKKIDVAIYLDKSARPVAWLVNELWDVLAPRGEDGEIPKRPKTKFLNIDREQWGAVIGRPEDKGGMNIDRLPADRLWELRALYEPIKGENKQYAQSLLTDKNVLIVDEVSVSGDTLTMSEAILKHAFHDAASIEGTYWMGGKVEATKTGERRNTKIPVWYSDTQITGRLVGNRDSSKSSKSSSSRQKIGGYWLSTPFREKRDEDGLRLKREVKRLGDDLRRHKILYRPTIGVWDEETLDKRMLDINGIPTNMYISLIKTAGNDIPKQIELYKEYMNRQKRISIAKKAGAASLKLPDLS